MSATAKIKLQFGTLSQPPGSPQTASIKVHLKDSTGTVIGTASINAPSGVPSANEADIPAWAGAGFTADAQALDATNAPVGSLITSAPFDMADNTMVTVVLGVTGGQ